MAAAQARGYEYIIVSDHSRSTTIAGGLGVEELRAQRAAIRALQPRFRIRILAGSECDILADGTLDFPDEVLAELDVVLAAVHSRFKQSRAEMTARIVRALGHPRVNVLVHPTGRRLGTREPYDVDLEAVFAAARAHGKAVEINSSPERMDLSDVHARRAGALGVAGGRQHRHPFPAGARPSGAGDRHRPARVARSPSRCSTPAPSTTCWPGPGPGGRPCGFARHRPIDSSHLVRPIG